MMQYIKYLNETSFVELEDISITKLQTMFWDVTET